MKKDNKMSEFFKKAANSAVPLAVTTAVKQSVPVAVIPAERTPLTSTALPPESKRKCMEATPMLQPIYALPVTKESNEVFKASPAPEPELTLAKKSATPIKHAPDKAVHIQAP